MWAEIASGEASVTSALFWAQHVAQLIKAEVVDGGLMGAERPRAALAAIGFRGPVDRYEEAKRHMDVYLSFFEDATNPDVVTMLKKHGHLVDMPHKDALTRVAEWRKHP
jgi:hypothetical protein